MIIRLLAAISGLAAVAVGAFGAHGIADPQAKAWIATGASYGLAHAAAALWASDRHATVALLMAAGALVFSASLYLLGLGAPRWIGAVAPIGGLMMLAGWALLIVQLLRNRS